MKKTFKELMEIDQMVGELYSKFTTLKYTEFGYAYKRFADNFYLPLIDQYREKIQATRIFHAMEDKKTKEILKDPTDILRGFRYTKEGLLAVIAEEKDILSEFNNKEVEIESCVSSFVPEGLTDKQRELLTGIVL